MADERASGVESGFFHFMYVETAKRNRTEWCGVFLPDTRGVPAGQNVVFDVDVKGGVNIKKYYGDEAMSLFIQPPSIAELRKRLEGRGTDAPEVIDQRIARAEFELTFADKFDKIVVNDDLAQAEADALEQVQAFLNE